LAQLPYVPHVDLFLQALRINRERLDSKSKIAIDAKLLKALLRAVVECGPFCEQFYLETYPDIAKAHEAGELPDLKQHYIEHGYFEGRVGAPAAVDEEYYASHYQDVAQAMTRGNLKSIAQHYQQSGYAEGRIPSAALEPAIEKWLSVLRENPGRG
jgi:hypothetical protein